MRKHQQKKVFELLQTLNEAHSELKNLLLRRAFSSFNQLADSCKEFVLVVKAFIEEIKGKGTKTAVLLMEYDEALTGIAPEANNVSTLMKYLQKQLVKIEKSVATELRPDKIEIVFFPYKASMWDCLESIYLAARIDPQCDAYVVPIPYYDRLPSGQFGQIHYEGGDYPDDIPITDWRQYDVEARMPDVIFIHNPYDDANYVTSVPPDFYSKRLKDFTDLLVYVPYFVLANDVPDHFCVCQGVIYADRVIIQSKGIREQYFRAFKEFNRANNLKNKFGKAEEKFVVLGSPKFDKTINTSREACALPDEWRKLIEKADGTNKKVVFYNTSVGAMLQKNEEYLEKLRSVIETFRSRGDVILWWRPHPLSAATFDSMRPQLREEYNRIVSEYRRQGWGIYDDTVDLHRAIAISDAMYGEFSSVGVLYSVTGKPVLAANYKLECSIDEDVKQEYLHSDIIQFGTQVLTIEEHERLYPTYHEYWLQFRRVDQSRFLYISCYEYGISCFLNAIYKMDEENGHAEYFMGFPDEENKPRLHYPPVKLGDKLLFIPNCARKWAFYDIKLDVWSYNAVPKELYPSKEWRAIFGGCIFYEDDLIILPGESGAFAKYNIDTGKITYHREWFSHLRGSVMNVDWNLISGILSYKNSLLLVSPQTNKILNLDPKTMSIKNTYRVCSDGYKFKTACLVPNTDIVYLIKFREPGCESWTETIIKWNINSGETIEFTDLPITFIKGHTLNALNGFLFFKDMLLVTPCQGDSVLKIDLQTDKITRFTLTPSFDFFERKSSYYQGWAKDLAMPYVIFNGKRMTFIAELPYDYGLADIDIETGQILNRRKWYVKGIEGLYKDREVGCRNPKLPLVESIFLTLDDFLNQLDSEELALANKEQLLSCCEYPAHADGTAGQAIYDYVKRLAGI